MTHYTLSVPDNPTSLRRAAEFFAGLCGCLVEPLPTVEEFEVDATTLGDHHRPTGTGIRGNRADVIIMDEIVSSPGLSIPPEPLPPVAMTEGIPAEMDEYADRVGMNEDAAAIFANVEPTPNEAGPPPPIPGIYVPVTGTPPPAVELADGIPWDERIHSSSKNKLKSPPHGWKLKKQPGEYNSKEEWLGYVASVEGELRAAVAGPPPMPPTGTRCSICGENQFNTPSGPVCKNGHGGAPPMAHVGPPPPPQPQGPPMPPTPPATGPLTFAVLTERIAMAGIQPPQVQQALFTLDLDNYTMLMKYPELIPRMAQLLGV